MVNSKNFHFFWVAWLSIICILSLLPGDQLPIVEIEWIEIDTFIHFVMYFMLSFLMCSAFFLKKNELYWSSALYIIGFGILTGWLIEYIQGAFISGRFYSIKDVIANGIGNVIGVLIFPNSKKKILNLVKYLQ